MLDQTIPLWLKDEGTLQRGLPVYVQLKERLRTAILSRQLEPGVALPEERELAGLVSVSRGTVRRALELLAEEGLIVRHHGRRTTVSSTEHLPAVPMAVIFENGETLGDHDYLGQLVRGLAGRASALGVELLLRDFNARRTALNPAVHLFIMPTHPEIMRELARGGQRVISMDTQVDGVDSVVYNNVGLFAEATQRLIALGHRRIAYIDVHHERNEARIPNPNSLLRKAGYCAAMDEAGLPHLVTHQNLNPDALAAVLPKFFEEARPTAVAAFDDTAALGAYLAAQSLGLSVPRDLSIVTIRLKEHLPRGGLDVSGGVVSQSELSARAIDHALSMVNQRKPTSGEVVKIPWAWHAGSTLAEPSSGT